MSAPGDRSVAGGQLSGALPHIKRDACPRSQHFWGQPNPQGCSTGRKGCPLPQQRALLKGNTGFRTLHRLS